LASRIARAGDDGARRAEEGRGRGGWALKSNVRAYCDHMRKLCKWCVQKVKATAARNKVSKRLGYRLARRAAKFGSESSLCDLLDRFAYDCLWRAEARSKKGKSACGVYLEQPRPPDAPPGMVKLRLIKKT
jgi:hypothetical protein